MRALESKADVTVTPTENIQVDKSLTAKYAGKTPFADKVAKANANLAKQGLPKNWTK